MDGSDDRRASRLTSSVGAMLFSAAIFAFFGFMMGLSTRDAAGNVVPLFFTLVWTLRGSAIGFALAAGFAMTSPRSGSLLYGVIGVVSAILLAVVGVWDLLSDWNTAVHPALLFIFAAWNGWSAWDGLKAVIVDQRSEIST